MTKDRPVLPKMNDSKGRAWDAGKHQDGDRFNTNEGFRKWKKKKKISNREEFSRKLESLSQSEASAGKAKYIEILSFLIENIKYASVNEISNILAGCIREGVRVYNVQLPKLTQKINEVCEESKASDLVNLLIKLSMLGFLEPDLKTAGLDFDKIISKINSDVKYFEPRNISDMLSMFHKLNFYRSDLIKLNFKKIFGQINDRIEIFNHLDFTHVIRALGSIEIDKRDIDDSTINSLIRGINRHIAEFTAEDTTFILSGLANMGYKWDDFSKYSKSFPDNILKWIHRDINIYNLNDISRVISALSMLRCSERNLTNLIAPLNKRLHTILDRSVSSKHEIDEKRLLKSEIVNQELNGFSLISKENLNLILKRYIVGIEHGHTTSPAQEKMASALARLPDSRVTSEIPIYEFSTPHQDQPIKFLTVDLLFETKISGKTWKIFIEIDGKRNHFYERINSKGNKVEEKNRRTKNRDKLTEKIISKDKDALYLTIPYHELEIDHLQSDDVVQKYVLEKINDAIIEKQRKRETDVSFEESSAKRPAATPASASSTGVQKSSPSRSLGE